MCFKKGLTRLLSDSDAHYVQRGRASPRPGFGLWRSLLILHLSGEGQSCGLEYEGLAGSTCFGVCEVPEVFDSFLGCSSDACLLALYMWETAKDRPRETLAQQSLVRCLERMPKSRPLASELTQLQQFLKGGPQMERTQSK